MSWLSSNAQEAETIFDALPDAYVRFDNQFRYTLVNRAAEQLIGKDRAELLGNVLWDVFPATVGTPFEEHYSRAMAERTPITFEDYYATRQRWYAITATPDSDGGMVVHLSDITERKRAEEALRRSEERFRQVAECASEFIWETDSLGRYTYCSPQMEKLWGIKPEEMIGKTPFDVMPEQDKNRGTEFFIRVVKSPQRFRGLQSAAYDRQGRLIYIETNGVPFYDDHGELLGFRGISMDITERRRAEEVLRNSELKYRRLHESITDAVATVDMAGHILEFNPVYQAMLGYTDEDLRRLTYQELTPEQWHAFEAKIIAEQVLPKGHSDVYEKEYRRRDGTVFPVELRTFLLRNERNEPTAMWAIVRDITERRRAEEALRRSEELFRYVIENLRDAVWCADLSGQLEFLSPLIAHIYGRPLSEMVANPAFWIEAAHPEDKAAVQASGDALLRDGHVELEYRILLPNGTERWISDRKTQLLDAHGKPSRIAGIVSSITERKRAEATLRESEERFRALAESSLVGIYVIQDGKYVYVNPAMAAVFGYSVAEMTGMSLCEIVQPDDHVKAVENIRRRITGEVRSMQYEVRGRHKDGSVRDVEVYGTRMEMNRGVALVGTLVDITERKRAEAERENLQFQLAQAQKMESIGRLAGGIAHDFNNLLTVINGYSRLLLAKLSAGDPLRAKLEEISKAGERAAALTRQLLAFGRRQVLQPHRLDLNRVVEEMRPMLERLVRESVEVRVALNAEGATVYADPHQLEQVIMNLVVNARDAMPGGGRLLIETAVAELDEDCVRSHLEARAGRYVMLAVSDTGGGMDEETRGRVFEPFFTTKGVGEGTGLGLSMVHGIVAQSGGHIDVASEPGVGTTFKIYLPALADAAVDAERPAAVPVLGGKETVLVVEDQAEVRDYTVEVLQSYGYRVIRAGNASEALLLCEREGRHIHLLLTDVVMPNGSGMELAARLERIRPGIKVLFMSGHRGDVIAEHGDLEEGAAFIQKPFSPEELAGKVRAVLGPPAPRILVADDEAGVRGFLRAALEEGGYEVTEAADGKQAIKEARAGHVDLVITDLVMPKQEGIETIRALRKEMPGIGIIAITGKFEGRYLEMIELLGADTVLTKPVSAELMLAKVAEALRKSRR